MSQSKKELEETKERINAMLDREIQKLEQKEQQPKKPDFFQENRHLVNIISQEDWERLETQHEQGESDPFLRSSSINDW